MKVAIMQPYFFPYLGQFQLINIVDRFILMDDVQYIRHGWINRNRILHAETGSQYIIAPVRKHSHQSLIRNIELVDEERWRKGILGQLQHYRKAAPYYTQVLKLVGECFKVKETGIARFNGRCFEAVCDYIGIPYKMEIASDMGFDYSSISETQDWAIEISRQLGATDYYNPPGGVELYNKERFDQNGINLHFVATVFNEYNQGRQDFIPGLSIIDVMMFNEPKQIRNMLKDYQEL